MAMTYCELPAKSQRYTWIATLIHDDVIEVEQFASHAAACGWVADKMREYNTPGDGGYVGPVFGRLMGEAWWAWSQSHGLRNHRSL